MSQDQIRSLGMRMIFIGSSRVFGWNLHNCVATMSSNQGRSVQAEGFPNSPILQLGHQAQSYVLESGVR
jgi:hypothetical protein